MDKYAYLLTTRKGSERVVNKNTRPLASIKSGLVRLKLEQLLFVDRVKNVIVPTNDEETIRVADYFCSDRIIVVARHEELGLSSTVLEDLINCIPTIVDAENTLIRNEVLFSDNSGMEERRAA